LRAEGKENLYGARLANASMIYCVITAAIVLVAGALFDFNEYLPMYLCLAVTVAAFVLSFWFRDETEKDCAERNVVASKTTFEKDKIPDAANSGGIIARGVGFLIVVLLATMLGNAVVYGGIENSQMLYKNLGLAATIATVCVFLGRVARILANVFYTRLRRIFGRRLIIWAAGLWVVALVLMGASFLLLAENLVAAVVLVTVGVVLFYFAVDPIWHEFQQAVMDNYAGAARNTVNLLRGMCTCIGRLAFGFAASAIVLEFSVGGVVLFYAGIAVLAAGVMGFLVKFSAKNSPSSGEGVER